jgi:hypothetical protein
MSPLTTYVLLMVAHVAFCIVGCFVIRFLDDRSES